MNLNPVQPHSLSLYHRLVLASVKWMKRRDGVRAVFVLLMNCEAGALPAMNASWKSGNKYSTGYFNVFFLRATTWVMHSFSFQSVCTCSNVAGYHQIIFYSSATPEPL